MNKLNQKPQTCQKSTAHLVGSRLWLAFGLNNYSNLGGGDAYASPSPCYIFENRINNSNSSFATFSKSISKLILSLNIINLMDNKLNLWPQAVTILSAYLYSRPNKALSRQSVHNRTGGRGIIFLGILRLLFTESHILQNISPLAQITGLDTGRCNDLPFLNLARTASPEG